MQDPQTLVIVMQWQEISQTLAWYVNGHNSGSKKLRDFVGADLIELGDRTFACSLTYSKNNQLITGVYIYVHIYIERSHIVTYVYVCM